MRALVIGADGFAGRWLLLHLADAGDRVTAAVGPRYRPPLHGADVTVQLDVRDGGGLSALVADAGVDVVYDLAGVSSRDDREDVDAAVGVTVIGAMNVLLACAKAVRPPRLVFVSTGYVYAPAASPVDEGSQLAPASLYAAAKLAAERALKTLGPFLGVEIVIARPFNHVGPGQADSFVVPTVARQVADVAAGITDHVDLADPSATRDFSDVRDIVAGYRLLATDGRSGKTYNLASGRGTSVNDVARILAAVAGVNVAVRATDEGRATSGPAVLVGDARRMLSLGWKPTHPLEETLADVIAPLLAGTH